MKLSEALTKLKNLKSNLSRVQGFVSESVVHYEDKDPEYIFVDELSTYGKLKDELLDLKTKIQKTNAVTTVNFNGSNVTITSLILLNAEYRDSLAFLNRLLQSSTDEGSFRFSGRTKDSIAKKFADGFDKKEIRKQIEELEQKREILEGTLTKVNATTELVGT